MRLRRLLLATLLLALGVTPARGAATGVPVVVFDGRGFGHGVGMAQDGAFWMAAAGSKTEQILGHFYPGVSLGRKAGFVRVPVLQGPTSATLSFPQGGDVQDTLDGSPSADGRLPILLDPGAVVRVSVDSAGYHVEVLRGAKPGRTYQEREPLLSPDTTTSTTTAIAEPTTTTAPPRDITTSAHPLLAVPADGGVVHVDARNRSYRGYIHVTQANGALRLVNQVDVEEYLRGMGEVRDPTWPLAALRSQAIVARTYALRAMHFGGEICETQRCQVYLGAQAEYAAMNKAVATSQGQVLVFQGELVAAVYSANGGGYSASAQEGFGPKAAGYPYLKPVAYRTSDPMAWQVRVGLADLGRRFGVAGARAVDVTRTGPSGRALDVTITGATSSKTISGVEMARAAGLRSTLFTARLAEDATAPTLPEGGGSPVELQGLPDDAAPAEILATVAPPKPAESGAVPPLHRASRSDRDDSASAALNTAPLSTEHWQPAALPAVVIALALCAVLLSRRRWLSPTGRHRR